MIKKRATSINTIFRAVISLGDQMRTMKGELDAKIENKIDSAKEEILKEIRPITKAVDKDAETIIKHEKRITRVESHLSLR